MVWVWCKASLRAHTAVRPRDRERSIRDAANDGAQACSRADTQLLQTGHECVLREELAPADASCKGHEPAAEIQMYLEVLS